MIIFIWLLIANNIVFAGKWWDNIPFEPVELTLNSGVYKGKAIDFDGKIVEIFRGKCRRFVS